MPDDQRGPGQSIFDAAAEMSFEGSEAQAFLGIPSHDNRHGTYTLMSLVQAGVPMHVSVWKSSLLAHGFNSLWWLAKTMPYAFPYFAMMHNDVGATGAWLKIMIDELEKFDADVMSAVIPIKSPSGEETSTAIGLIPEPKYEQHFRRLRTSDCMQLPPTFGRGDVSQFVGIPKNRIGPLMINTGLWVCKFQEPWRDEFPGFNITSGIDERGPWVKPEDWQFGEWLHKQGLKVMATRRVQVTHAGERIWGFGG